MIGFLPAFYFEFTQLRARATTYIFLIFAWVATTLAAFYIGGFFTAGRADMLSFFMYQPWVYLFFIPAIGMGAWAEEWQVRTAERLFSLPISPYAANMAKFMALWGLFAFMLLGTFPFVLTLAWLGNPDWGPIISGYIGCFLLGGTFLSLTLFSSAITRHVSGAFVLSVVLIFMMIAAGWGLFLNVLEGLVPQQLLDLFVTFSLLDRFRNFYIGLLDIRDILFFLSLIVFFNVLNWRVLCRQLGFTGGQWIMWVVFVILIGLNTLAAHVLPYKWDVTHKNLHTLSQSSIEKIKAINEDLKITFYYSKHNPALSVPIQQHARRVEDMLKDVARLNPRISVRFVMPSKNIDDEIQGLERGIVEVPLPTGEGFYFGTTFEMGERGTSVPYMDPVRASFLEFDILSAIAGLQKTKRQHIGIMTELNLGDHKARPRFISELLGSYKLSFIKNGHPFLPEDIDLLILFLTPFMSTESVYALDQYITKGGKALILLDPFMRTAPSDDFLTPDRNADNWAVDHPADLLRSWGAAYNYKEVVGDRALALPVQMEGLGLTTYPLWLNLGEANINKTLPFTAFVSNIELIEPGFFTPIKLPESIQYEPIFMTSDVAQTVSRSLFNEVDAQGIGGALAGEEKVRDLAILMTGKFKSAFDTMPQAVKQYYIDMADDLDNIVYPNHVLNSKKEGALIAVADIDMLADDYAMTHEKTVQGDIVLRPANDNLIFMFNAVQYLLGDTSLLSIRGKAVEQNSFIKVDEKMQQLAKAFQAVEQQYALELFEVTQRLQALESREKHRNLKEADIELEIINFRKKELELRKKLRDVRRIFREDIYILGRTLMLINIFAIPFLVGLYAIFFFRRRRKKATV